MDISAALETLERRSGFRVDFQVRDRSVNGLITLKPLIYRLPKFDGYRSLNVSLVIENNEVTPLGPFDKLMVLFNNDWETRIRSDNKLVEALKETRGNSIFGTISEYETLQDSIPVYIMPIIALPRYDLTGQIARWERENIKYTK